MSYELIQASAHDTGLPDASVHCIVTSPPYFGLRAYDGDQAVEWPAVEYAPMPGLPAITIEPMTCGLGEEPTPEAFIGHMVLVMREMWRVLRDDGTAWVNLGDSFAANGTSGLNVKGSTSTLVGSENTAHTAQKKRVPNGLRAKAKILIPHRFAFAMQAEGWIVRQDIVWAKGVSCLPDYAGSCMPESVTDRPTNGHEYMFLLTKGPRYFYDAEAVKEGSTGQNGAAASFARETKDHLIPGQSAVQHRNGRKPTEDNGKRNLRSVWAINPGSYPGAHFATFPERLPELAIQAGTSAKGVCSKCGAPWVRVVERTAMEVRTSEKGAVKHANGLRTSTSGTMTKPPTSQTTGWRPSCDCNAGDPIPATVLDPFNGAGTSGMVALRHNRNYIGIDLSADYFEQTRERLAGTQPMLPGVLA